MLGYLAVTAAPRKATFAQNVFGKKRLLTNRQHRLDLAQLPQPKVNPPKLSG